MEAGSRTRPLVLAESFPVAPVVAAPIEGALNPALAAATLIRVAMIPLRVAFLTVPAAVIPLRVASVPIRVGTVPDRVGTNHSR